LSENPSKPKRPFFSPFVKEFLELILEADAKPSRGRRKKTTRGSARAS
jgi:hypothetical protein